MSQKWLNLVRDSGPEHPETRELVRALADYANDYGVAWPSIPSIAEYLRITERAVYYRLRAAKADGWLVVDSGGGRRKSNTYTLVGERFDTIVRNPERNPATNPARNPAADFTVSGETLKPASKNPETGFTQPPRPPKSSSPHVDDPLPAVLAAVAP